MFLRALLVALCLGTATLSAADDPALPKPLELAGLHQVFDLGSNVISGSVPETDADFAALAKRGIKVILSVDGSKPYVDLAHKYGLRYIHLPVGYDGISAQRALEISKVATEEKEPMYVHCHHGKHRGPAAAALLLETRAGWTPDQAEAWLKQAGTAPEYAGLYKSVHDFKAPTSETLAKISAKFPEVTPPAPLVDAMVALDEHFDQLKAAQKNGWKEVPGHPDLTPAQAATLVWENLREQARLPEIEKKPAAYHAKLAAAEQSVAALRTLLAEPKPDPLRLDAALQSAGQSCTDCHKVHRN
jgi:protein tyrosine phosphatase (PTP) superfamily phosphohydrolase (DUF442 family)/cytochrome c556